MNNHLKYNRSNDKCIIFRLSRPTANMKILKKNIKFKNIINNVMYHQEYELGIL